jgi:hypothetical protein
MHCLEHALFGTCTVWNHLSAFDWKGRDVAAQPECCTSVEAQVRPLSWDRCLCHMGESPKLHYPLITDQSVRDL